MSHIKFDYSKVLDKFVAPHEVEYMQSQVTAADELIRKGTGAGSDFLGWLDLPENYDREEFGRILKAAEQIKSDSDVLVVGSTKGNIDKLDTTADCHNWFILTERFFQKRQFKFITD